MKSHLDTECPCYCPYCDITAEREVISSEHKEKCYKFPLSCPNNIGVNNAPHDKANNINELQDEVVNDVLSPSILIELQNNINTVREEAAQSLQIAKQYSDKTDKQNDTSQLYNIRLYFTIAIVTILIALLVQSHYSLSECRQHITRLQDKLQEQITQLQEKFQEHTTLFHEQTTQLQEKFQEQDTQLQEKIQELNIQLQGVQ